jgi:hypothetical protein
MLRWFGSASRFHVPPSENVSIGRDVRHLRIRAWSCWQPVEALDWVLLDGEYDDAAPNPDGGANGTLEGRVGGVNPKYYVLAHDPATGRLSLVTATAGASRDVTYDLRALIEGADLVRQWTTDTTITPTARRYAPAPDTYLREGMLTVTHEANTVTNLEVEDVQADGVSERKVWPSSGPRPK